MMGFKAFHSAEATIAGVELHRMFKKGQHSGAANIPVHEHILCISGITTSRRNLY